MVVFMPMFVPVGMVMTMVVIVVVMLVHVVMDVVMYMEMGNGVYMLMIVVMSRVLVMLAVVTIMVMIVVIVIMVMVLVVPLLMAVDGHRHVGTRDAAGHRRLRRHMDAGETQSVHFFQKGGLLLFTQKLKEGGGEHVPGTPHGTFDVKGFHVTSPPVLPFD